MQATAASSAHVFVCHGALSFDAARRIAAELPPGVSVYFLLFFPLRSPRVGSAKLVAMTEALRSEWRKPFVMARYLRQALDLLAEDRIETIVAYLSHPFDPPGNWFAHFDQRVVRRELLPDGLVNYLDSPHRPTGPWRRLRYEVRVLLRRLAAARYGLGYRPLGPGHITQYERIEYERAWTDQPVGFRTTRAGNLALLPAPPRAEQELAISGETRVLVVDQELGSLVSPQLERELRARTVGLLAELDPGRVYYKAHPRGQNRSAGFGRAVEDVSGDLLAEELVPKLGVTHVVGYYSSALLRDYGDPVQRIAILPHLDGSGLIKREYLAEVQDVLRGASVRLLLL